MIKLMFLASSLIVSLAQAKEVFWTGEKSESAKLKPKAILEKSPKAIFLVKKAKINAEVGEPQFYPADNQLRTVINDKTLHNFEKFE